MGREYKAEFGFVVLLDFLGVRNYNIEQVKTFLHERDTVIKSMGDVRFDYTLRGEQYSVPCFTTPRILTFADNIVFALEVEETLEIRHFLWVGQWLTKLVDYYLQHGHLLRGAVAIGEYVADQGSTILGPAVSDAADWYEEADWVGVMATPSATSKLERLTAEN